MSRPWLQDDFKPSSKSRSRSSSRSPSKSRKTRIDEFGRTVPVKSRDKSRSRSRSNERRRHSAEKGKGRYPRESRHDQRSLSRDSGRREEKFVKRRRRGSSSGSNKSDNERVRPVASNKPKYENARLFVANIDVNKITKVDLMEHFTQYGNVIDVLVHPRNYAFIQYTKEAEALAAVEGESDKTFQGRKLDVKLAIYGKKGGGSDRGRGQTRRGRDGGFGRDRGPPRNDSPEDFRPGRLRPQPEGYPGEMRMRDPCYPPPGPYPGFEGPWFPGPDVPFRPDPYEDPYRDPYSARAPATAPPPPKIECQIFLVSPKLRNYGETIESRVKEHCIITAVTVMPEGETASRMLENFADRDGLFAIFVNAQNEMHRSLTLNIIHGTPQEHRNMPMNDAIALVGRSFEEYVDTLREKAKTASSATSSLDSSAKSATAAKTSQGFLAASSDVTYLLNLLADNQALTVSELNEVIEYLKRRRSKMMDAEKKNQTNNDPNQEPGTSKISNTDEITQKILSIFSSAGGNIQGILPSATQGQQQQQGQPQYQHPPQAHPPPPPPPPPPAEPQPMQQQIPKAAGNSVINFDNPNVQKAIDQLIQSSPVLRQNFGVPAEEAPVPSIESVSQVVGRSSMIGYGHNQSPALGHGREGPQQSSHEWSSGQKGYPPPGGSRPHQKNF